MRLPASLALSLAFTVSPLAQATSADPVLAQADQLIARQQPQAAFDLLVPLEEARAGEPDYDYLLGLAALEIGQGGIAAFAFERCLAMDPANGPCRVQMARTHLALGETGSARLELETVQATQPPQEVSELVNRYLGALTRREQEASRRVDVHAQLGGGYDTNVSGTTDATTIAIPRLGGLPFTLSGVSTKQEDAFLQAEAGASLDYALAPAWRLLADATVASRQYLDVDTFSSISSDAGLGLGWMAGANSMQAKVQLQDYRLDEEAFRSLYGIMTQFQHAYGETAAVSVYAQASHIDYHLGNPDARRYTLGSGYSRAFGSARATTVYAGLYGGTEESDSPGIGLGQDFAGLRLGGSRVLAARLALTAALSIEQRSFEGISPLFLVEREDTGVDASLGAILKLSDKLSLKPAYTYSSSDSNTVLSDYDRHLVSVDLRFDM
ncbi:MAG: outer membrane beta-barrel protein [Pseudomonadota bacterium]